MCCLDTDLFSSFDFHLDVNIAVLSASNLELELEMRASNVCKNPLNCLVNVAELQRSIFEDFLVWLFKESIIKGEG